MRFDVLVELSAIHERTLALAEQIAPETLREVGRVEWYGTSYSTEEFLIYVNFAHKREHAAQIHQFREQLRAQV